MPSSASGFVQLCYKFGLTDSYIPLILPGIAAPVVFFYMKALQDVAAEEIVEETFELPEAEEATTTLGSLFANIKL